jgi:uncharacterized protein YoxC
MSNDDPTKFLSDDDRWASLLLLVNRIANDVEDVKSRLSTVEEKVEDVKSSLSTLEEKVDARLRQTQPIWESVLTKLDDMETRMDRIEGTALTTRSELRELRRELRDHLPALK